MGVEQEAKPFGSSAPCEPVKAVLFDLDGTVLDTETLVLEVVRSVVESHGKTLTSDTAATALGMRPLDAWAAVADTLQIQRSAQQLYEQSEPLLRDRWHEAPLMPGVARLVAHLKLHGITLALATSTPRDTLDRKLSTKAAMRAAFVHSCCGDEVDKGKPAPDCFLQLAERLGVPPSQCLVVEDAPAGVTAAAAAGMRVVAVPSMLQQHGGKPSQLYPQPEADAASGCISLLPSLLDFRPEVYGLPQFEDRIGETIPMHPVLRIKGTVVKGFGRGSRELGIPTANVDANSLRGVLAEAVTGIFAGWASVGDDPAIYKTAMSIGWNPVFANKEKTAEPWLLHDFGGRDFVGQEIRLLVCAYIRPEANFESLQALIDRIHRDAEVAEEALEHEAYQQYRREAFLQPQTAAVPAALEEQQQQQQTGEQQGTAASGAS